MMTGSSTQWLLESTICHTDLFSRHLPVWYSFISRYLKQDYFLCTSLSRFYP